LTSPSYTCLRCGRTSYNENDVQHRYCGHCHASSGTVQVSLSLGKRERSPWVFLIEYVVYVVLAGAGVLVVKEWLPNLAFWKTVIVDMAIGYLAAQQVWRR
jgi:hypothetical protein